MSIQPKWVEKIANGEKTIEVRKSCPKLETPFKVYIYETNWCDNTYWKHQHKGRLGKVIGEFVCDEITPLFNVATTSWNLLAGNIHEYAKGLVRMARLTEEEMHSYANGKNCYAWHISQLKIYDKPKELRQFRTITNCGSIIAKDMLCNTCCICSDFCTKKPKRITRPPQSWCYVEELKSVSR